MEINEQTEQRTDEQILGETQKKTPQEMTEMLTTVYGNSFFFFKWIKRFNKGRESSKNDARSS